MAQPTYTKVGGSSAHRPFVKDFLALAQGVSRREGWREAEVFGDWLTAASCAIAGSAFKMKFDDISWEKNEARYMEIVKRSRHKTETMSDMSKMLGVVVEALESERGDFLSPIFDEIATSAERGQFMTPFALSEAMARMTLRDPDVLLANAKADGRSWISCSEPCVGMGSMVLAATKVFTEHGIDPARQAHWVCVDIDWKAVCGAYIQLSLCGVSATVIHGNTLSLEEWASLPTPMAVIYPKIQRAQPITDTPLELPENPVIEDDALPDASAFLPSVAKAGQMDFGF